MVNKNIISWLERHNKDVETILKANEKYRKENEHLKIQISYYKKLLSKIANGEDLTTGEINTYMNFIELEDKQ